MSLQFPEMIFQFTHTAIILNTLSTTLNLFWCHNRYSYKCPRCNIFFLTNRSRNHYDIGPSLRLSFQVVNNLSKPFASVWGIVHQQHRAVSDDPISYIENTRSNRWTRFREEGKVYFLDIWVQVPRSNMPDPSLVRQVASS